MKGFFSFVRKETLHILRDRRTMLIVLLMPVVQLLLFGFAISVEVNNIDFAVVASHPTEAVRRQVERIAANPYFTFGGYIRQDEADEVLRTGEVGAVVVFAADYDRRTAGSGEPDGAAIQLISMPRIPTTPPPAQGTCEASCWRRGRAARRRPNCICFTIRR